MGEVRAKHWVGEVSVKTWVLRIVLMFGVFGCQSETESAADDSAMNRYDNVRMEGRNSDPNVGADGGSEADQDQAEADSSARDAAGVRDVYVPPTDAGTTFGDAAYPDYGYWDATYPDVPPWDAAYPDAPLWDAADAAPRTPISGMCHRTRGDTCIADADCVPGGCGGELCHNPTFGAAITTCNCTQPVEPCGCVGGTCKWYY